MYETDAKRMGKETHTREMTFLKGYVSCNACACNYNCQAATAGITVRTFCQIFNMSVDPTKTEENIAKAENCKFWVHEKLDRNQVVSPDHTYHYERYQ